MLNAAREEGPRRHGPWSAIVAMAGVLGALAGCRSEPAPMAAGQSGGSAASDANGVGVTPSTGCQATPDGSRRNVTLTVDGVARHLYVVPPASGAAEPVAAVIGFHGYGGTGQPMADLFGLGSASGGKLLGLYPDGVVQTWYQNAIGWDTRSADNADMKFVDAIIAWAESSYCVDTSRWHSVGFSWGGWMANHVGCARANHFRSVVSVSGGGPSIVCEGPAAVMIVHGTADKDEPIAAGQESVKKWIAVDGCQTGIDPALSGACVQYRGCSAGHPVLWCQHSGGHEWPAFLAGGGLWSWLSRP